METPKQEQSAEALQSPERVQEKIKVLNDIVEEFRAHVDPAIREHVGVAEIVFKQEGGYDNDLKRQKFAHLLDMLGRFQDNIKAKIEMYPTKPDEGHLNMLWSQLQVVKKALTVAPDIRYSREAQIQKFGGEENVPGGKSYEVWETTKELVTTLQGFMKGLETAAKFIKAE